MGQPRISATPSRCRFLGLVLAVAARVGLDGGREQGRARPQAVKNLGREAPPLAALRPCPTPLGLLRGGEGGFGPPQPPPGARRHPRPSAPVRHGHAHLLIATQHQSHPVRGLPERPKRRSPPGGSPPRPTRRTLSIFMRPRAPLPEAATQRQHQLPRRDREVPVGPGTCELVRPGTPPRSSGLADAARHSPGSVS